MRLVYVTRAVNVTTLVLVAAFLMTGHWFVALITLGVWWLVRAAFRGLFF